MPAGAGGYAADGAGTAPTSVQTNDGDTSYRNVGPGKGDMFTLNGTVPAGVTVTDITVWLVAMSIAADKKLYFVTWDGFIDTVDALPTALTGAYAVYHKVLAGPFTVAQANALQVGYLATDTGFRVTQAFAMVSYTP